jgi:hypothetical protein
MLDPGSGETAVNHTISDRAAMAGDPVNFGGNDQPAELKVNYCKFNVGSV